MQLSDRQATSFQSPQPLFAPRIASVSRTTGETDVQVSINLDGNGQCNAATGSPF